MLRVIVLVIFLISLNGCFGIAKPKKSVATYPNWFLNYPQDSSRFIYAVGEGVDEKEASLDALSRVASKISVEVESSYQSHRVVANGREISKNQSVDMKQSVKKIEFNDYSIIKREKFQNRYILLLRVDRVKTAENLKRVLIDELNSLETSIDIQTSTQVEKIGIYEKARDSLSSIEKRASIIKTISPNVEDRDIFQRVRRDRERIADYLSRVEFRVKDGSKYGDVIKKIIGEQGYKISNSSNAITISINLKKNGVYVMGNYIMKVEIALKVKEGDKIVSTDNIMVAGKSRTGFNVAEEFAVKEFEMRLKESRAFQKLIGTKN